MSKKFKVGDRVVGTEQQDAVDIKGMVGTVVVVCGDGYDYGIEFDERNDAFHSCGRSGKNKHCYWVYENRIEKYVNETIVIYRKGNQVIAHNKATDKKAVAKCNPEDTFDFNIGAKLAFERLMTTKCIVKQDQYEVGDKVKIIDKWIPGCHENFRGKMDKYLGTVMTIREISIYGCYRMEEDKHDHNDGWFWYDKAIEGKVSEDYKYVETTPIPVKEVKRHAKVGEYIKIVNGGYYNAGDYEVGDILKVIGMYRNPSYGMVKTINLRTNEETVYVKPEEYVVLEGYKPTEPIKEEPKKLYNGKVVCINNSGNTHTYTVGKIYEFKDGKLTTDNGLLYPKFVPIYTFEDWDRWTSAKFIEVVE